MALSGDGRTLLVGAYAVTVNSNVKQGAAYVFRRSAAGAWAQEAKLLASDGVAGDSFGYFVTLSLDGNTALVSSFGDDAPLGSGNGRGSAFHVFTRFGDSVPGLPSPWLPTFKITALDGTSTDWFGGSASMSADGLNVAIGAGDENNGANVSQSLTSSSPLNTIAAHQCLAELATGC